MGTAPPEDAPSPAEQDAAAVEASFEPSPSGDILCDFGVPSFQLSLNFQIPGIPSFTLPSFDYFLAMNCDLSDPLDAQFGFGGGRVASFDKDQDDAFAEG